METKLLLTRVSLACIMLWLTPDAKSQLVPQRLKSFGFTNALSYPQGTLILGSDGFLYGTTSRGDYSGDTVFKISTNGGAITILHRFDGLNGEGSKPIGALLQANDGYLYGTTYYGGTNSWYGTVFKVSTNGTGYSVLHFFGGDGYHPYGGLIQGRDGALYGTTSEAGGTIFRMTTDGTSFSMLHTFAGADGSRPNPGLVQGEDGYLYGTTYYGGTNSAGTVFKMNTNGGYAVLYNFLNALLNTGVGVCGGPVVKALAGRTEPQANRN